MLTLDRVKEYESNFISDPGGSNWHVSSRGEERLSSVDLIMRQLDFFSESRWKKSSEKYLVLPEKSGLYTLCLAHKLTAAGYDLKTAIQEMIHVVPTNRLSLVRVKKVTGYKPTNTYKLDTSVTWDASDYNGDEKLYAKYRPGTASYKQNKKSLPRPLVPALFTLTVENKSGNRSNLKLKPKMNREKLTVIGNPPWHEYDDGHGSSASPMEDEFVKLGKKLGTSTCFVMPSRGLFGEGKGLKSFTDWFLNREDVVSIKHWENDNSPFPGVDMTGGVSVVYTDEEVDAEKTEFNEEKIDLSKYDILVSETEDYNILDSVLNNADTFLNDIYIPRGYSGIGTSDDRMNEKRQTSEDIVCYASQKQGFKNYVHPDETDHAGGGVWKVATANANGEYPEFGNTFVVKPNETFSDSYIGFEVGSAREAISLRTYMKTNFAEFLLAKRKRKHITGKTVKWIPVPPLDRIWTDEELAEEELFGLSQEQWKRFTQQDD
jgi:hypothetical protein